MPLPNFSIWAQKYARKIFRAYYNVSVSVFPVLPAIFSVKSAENQSVRLPRNFSRRSMPSLMFSRDVA